MQVRSTFSRLVAALVLGGLACQMPVAASEPEDELKAAIVLSFLRYSEWPAPAGGDPALTVGVLGRPSLVQTLRRVLGGKAVDNRPVKILEIKPGEDPHCCQILYLATGKPGEIKQALAGANAARTLTIGETDRFLQFGGAVNLLIVDGRMGFEVSLEALERSGIIISSKLLRLGQLHSSGKGRPPA